MIALVCILFGIDLKIEVSGALDEALQEMAEAEIETHVRTQMGNLPFPCENTYVI